MSHYTVEVWADWARGHLSQELSTRMNEHLREACSDCRTAQDLWSQIAVVAGRELDYEPPEPVLRHARALFAQHRIDSLLNRPVRVAELLFDSWRSPRPEGVRSLQPSTRHLNYKAGSYFIDVRIEERTGSETAAVVGQLMRHPEATRLSLEGLSVILTSGRTTLAETRTNRFGEFVFEMDPDVENHLAIGVGDEFAVVVPLGRRES